MKAILVTKRFNPGHVSHLQANSRLLREHGFDVKYNVHKKYSLFPDFWIKSHLSTFSDLPTLRESDLYIVWFPSVLVIFELFVVRLFSEATTVYVYHEPYTSFSSYRAAGFSWLKTVRVSAISLVSRIICALSHKIILPSARAFDAVPNAKHLPHRFAQFNLMFSDEVSHQEDFHLRTHLSYIGTIAEDHAFDEFVRLMQACIAAQLLLPFRFLIASPSQIPSKYTAVIGQCVSSGRLLLHSGTPMKNKQINSFYSQSFVVWNAYRRSMQSGVLPKAYMFGAPVLVSTSNTSEHFEDGVHGVLISNRYSVEEFCQSISTLELSWTSISQNCRNYYLHNFDYHAISANYMNFVTLKQ